MSATAVTGTLGGGQIYVGFGGGREMIFHLKMRLTLRSVPTQQLAVIRQCALVTHCKLSTSKPQLSQSCTTLYTETIRCRLF